ncbi:hypothetical protein [Rubrimonas cliftonensis]|uniref:VPLPA-CTERM protein sorting domain-containing protein n=1 Tax=Rubrimonas cliftonensis TaxID=89524 RepID=A0A1H4G3C0_9RHOB|nr:hypothetical protein [Rubrimonas cliftonensis]SEB03811.1 hypothetical protein SAMN05444370_1355 [Rubrimonas cliftonensis]
MTIRPMATALAAALVFLIAGMAAAASLSARPSTTLFEGSVGYSIDLADGLGLAIAATTDGAFLMELSGAFDPDTSGDNPFGVNLLLSDATTLETAISAIWLEDIEVGTGFVALLPGDLTGSAAGDFTNGKLLAILRDAAFPALLGDAEFELRRLDDLTPIPLPPALLLALAGLGALVITGRRRA